MEKTYNGWKNYQTWNVSLWIGNDEFLYSLAKRSGSYEEFVNNLECLDSIDDLRFRTPDNVSWNDSGLDINAINEMILEL